MSYVIAEPCEGCLHARCVSVCPMDCIHGPVELRDLEALGPQERRVRLPTVQLFIDATLCIDCDACAQECPEEAIFPEEELPEAWRGYAERGRRFFAERGG